MTSCIIRPLDLFCLKKASLTELSVVSLMSDIFLYNVPAKKTYL